MDLSSCIKLLKVARKTRSVVFAGSSQSISNDLIKACITMVDDNRNTIKLIIDDDYVSIVDEVISGSSLLDLILPDQSMISTVPIVEIIDKKTIVAELPIFHKVLERRDNKRVGQIDLPCDVTINSSGIKIRSRRCYDVSSDGLSTVVNNDEFRVLKNKIGSFEMHVDFQDETVLINSDLVHFTALTPFDYEEYPYGGVKLSFRFKERNGIIQKIINDYSLRR